MTEEIIIDGVDVAECEHHLSTGYCQLQMIFQGMVLQLPFGKHLECNLCDKDCYYKQLKRLEQENNSLKQNLEQYKMSKQKSYEILQKRLNDVEWEKRELAQENKELKEQLLEDKILDEHIESLSREDIYRSALEEIKILATKDVQFENFVKIQKIILEVLG